MGFRISNKAEFETQLKKWAEEVQIDSVKAAKSFILEAQKEIILRTPVDTGRLRNSWIPGVDRIDTSTAPVDGDKNGFMLDKTAKNLRAEPQKFLYLTNSVKYGEANNYGRADQPNRKAQYFLERGIQAAIGEFKARR